MIRPVGIGAAIGATLGALFAFAVISFADCAGPSCSYERMVGVLGHALAGALAGALLGLAVAMVARLRSRRGR